MSPDRRLALEELRSAIERLPSSTREAMLAGVRSNTVITGAYTDSNSGVCPMLAAHRCGGRTDFLSFADAWDQFTGVYGRNICRPATRHEVCTLVAQLSESLGLAPTTSDLTAAIAEHTALAVHRTAAPDPRAAKVDHQSVVRVHRDARRSTSPSLAGTSATPRRRRRVKAEPSEFAAVIAEHRAAIEARQAEEARLRAREEPVDLAAAIADHQAIARARREREAAQVGVLWMSGNDFVVAPAPQPEPKRTGRRREPVLA